MSTPAILRVVVSDAETLEIPLLPFDRLTVADYLRISEPASDEEQPHQLVARVFGIPERITWVMTAQEVQDLLAWYLEWMKGSADAWAGVKRVTEALDNWADPTEPWTLEHAVGLLKGEGLHRTTIEVEGRSFVVPQRLEHATLWGQWLSLKHAADKHTGPEATLYPKVLATLCLEPGELWPRQERDETPEAFDERFGEWMTERRATFHRARMVDALAACAFFLSSSGQFRAIMSHSSTACPNWMKHWRAPEPQTTESAGAPSH